MEESRNLRIRVLYRSPDNLQESQGFGVTVKCQFRSPSRRCMDYWPHRLGVLTAQPRLGNHGGRGGYPLCLARLAAVPVVNNLSGLLPVILLTLGISVARLLGEQHKDFFLSMLSVLHIEEPTLHVCIQYLVGKRHLNSAESAPGQRPRVSALYF